MSSRGGFARRVEARANDIVTAVNRIRGYIRGYSQLDYFNDQKTQAAVERELERISEACVRIRALEKAAHTADSKTLEHRFPNVPWAQIRGLGNRLRHAYDRIEAKIIWRTVAESNDLHDLKNALTSAFPHVAIDK